MVIYQVRHDTFKLQPQRLALTRTELLKPCPSVNRVLLNKKLALLAVSPSFPVKHCALLTAVWDQILIRIFVLRQCFDKLPKFCRQQKQPEKKNICFQSFVTELKKHSRISSNKEKALFFWPCGYLC